MEIQQLPTLPSNSASLPTQLQSQDTNDDGSIQLPPIPAILPRVPQLAHLGTAADFARAYNPSIIGKCTILPARTIFSAKSPSLFWLSKNYTPTITTQWIMCFLVDLSEYSGIKNKITPRQLTGLAEALHSRFTNYKASELMLFFGMIKNGSFGRIGYGSFDPFSILAMIPDFLNYRSDIIRQEEERKKEIQLQRDREGCVPPPPEIAERLRKTLASFGIETKQE